MPPLLQILGITTTISVVISLAGLGLFGLALRYRLRQSHQALEAIIRRQGEHISTLKIALAAQQREMEKLRATPKLREMTELREAVESVRVLAALLASGQLRMHHRLKVSRAESSAVAAERATGSRA